jgi:hypothetical protein
MSRSVYASWRTAFHFVLAVVAILVIAGAPEPLAGQGTTARWKVIAWNNLGMHCLDADFSVFAILPPYNTIQAQVIDPSGRLVSNSSSVRLFYEAVADPSGSINTTSAGKTNFWSFVAPLFGVALPVDAGLAGYPMPGPANLRQPMTFDAVRRWFIAEGIPISPTDDGGSTSYYPLMKVTATDVNGTALASTRLVLPVSDEMDCAACHLSGTVVAARPAAGWVNELSSRQRDYRLNILRLHDDRQPPSGAIAPMLAKRGYRADGLYVTAASGTPILCAACHASEALPGTGEAGVAPLTAAMHGLHARVVDPTNGLSLDSAANRSACYRCHPGSETRCLRGAMGNAVAADGSMAMQCQNCHGSMSAVGSPSRTGWLQEPACQNCHTGTAVSNSGAIRYTSAFDGSGQLRSPASRTFATSPDTPAAGLSLYRFSSGHGGLQCSACHGSTHAEYPSAHANDNLQSQDVQGHAGTLAECNACHASSPSTVSGGPHGMHPVGSAWASGHGDAAENNRTQCQACHGTDYRGTVLSRALGPRTLTTKFGTRQLFRGAQIGCYTCHNGPSSDSTSSNHAPSAASMSVGTTSGTPVEVSLSATDADANPLSFRIVSQPANGTVGLSGTSARYYPAPGFTGTDTFTYAAWDGSIDSNLAAVTVRVATPPTTRYFAEGASNGVFDTAFAFVNPGGSPANVHLRFLRQDSVTLTYDFQLPALSRRTLNAKSVPGLTPAGGFSTVLESDGGIVADRTMTWLPYGNGAHSETSVAAPAATWYLAEGATQGGFKLFYLLQNPNALDAAVEVRYLRPAGQPPIVKTYTVPANTRTTIYVNGEDAALAATDVSAVVRSLDAALPIIVERSLYRSFQGQDFAAGHNSAGVTSPATTWFFAEGATGPTFDMYVLLANPTSSAAAVSAAYLLPDGSTIDRSYVVDANSRRTIWVNAEDSQLARTSVSVRVSSTNDVPIIAERAMWWPRDNWYEAHNSPGTLVTGTTWALAEGEQGGTDQRDTYILVANTSVFPGLVRVTLLFEDGSTAGTTVNVPALSRTTLNAGVTFGALVSNRKFGAIVESLPLGGAAAQLVVERAMYWNNGGVRWSAGTDALATKLR